MLFTLKKIVGGLLLPLPALLLLIGIGIALLWFSRFQRTGKLCVSLGWLLLTPSSNRINNSLPRLTEGIRLWQANPGSKMIFTGAAAKTNPVSTAEAGARVAESLGVPRSDIIVLDRPKDTEEEALAVKRAIGDAPFLLVTSASHLPRAMIFFRHAGLDPLPAPANQLAVTSPLNPWERAIPSPVWLMHSDRVGYETLGRVWQWLKGSSGEPGQE